jgi:glycosyltransferase involved in cell wall biosynthesis
VRITHLSTYDVTGGAARAAYRLHTGLCKLGQDSRMVVLYRSSPDPTVLQFRPPMDLRTRLRRGLKRRLLGREWKTLPYFPDGATPFSGDQSQHGADILGQLPPTDVLHLHWISGFIDYGTFFRKLPPGLPVVWTLHDMNAFTGGCHYDGACGRFVQTCGACPQLGSANPRDFSSQVWRRKLQAFSKGGADRLQVVTPSRWLAEAARGSSLLSDHRTIVIPYGIDTESFQPRDRNLAREKFGIPAGAKTILFVADATGEKRKGLRILLEALGGLPEGAGYFFAAIGHGLRSEAQGIKCMMIDYLADETALSFVYSAADVFVIPSLQDNLPNTAIEALSCGIPTIGSDVGGIQEVVRNRQTGLLVPPGDPGALRQAIVELLKNGELLAAMARESRRVALEEYALGVQAERYVKLYGGVRQ